MDKYIIKYFNIFDTTDINDINRYIINKFIIETLFILKHDIARTSLFAVPCIFISDYFWNKYYFSIRIDGYNQYYINFIDIRNKDEQTRYYIALSNGINMTKRINNIKIKKEFNSFNTDTIDLFIDEIYSYIHTNY